MSTDPTPAQLADYDQGHAETLTYLGALVTTLRGLSRGATPRPVAVAMLARQLAHPHPDTPAGARFAPDDVAQMLAVAVDRLEPRWDA